MTAAAAAPAPDAGAEESSAHLDNMVVKFWIDENNILHVVDSAGNVTLHDDPEVYLANDDAHEQL